MEFRLKLFWKSLVFTCILLFVVIYSISDLLRVKESFAGQYSLPSPNQLLKTTAEFEEMNLVGISVNYQDPTALEFIVKGGDENFDKRNYQLNRNRLLEYFIAALSVPQEDLWVNLSPYEDDRIISDPLSKTQLGRDMLEQDYILKQLSSSLTYPDSDIGQKYWDAIHELPDADTQKMDLFKKVWIVPDEAQILENKDGAVIEGTNFKVLSSKDYAAMGELELAEANDHEKDIVNELLIPAISREVNTGSNFVKLRQLYNCVLLANWFKSKLKESIMEQRFVDKNQVELISIEEDSKTKIYNQYLSAVAQGVYNLVKKEKVNSGGETKFVKRRYFSGGLLLSSSSIVKKLIGKPVEYLRQKFNDISPVNIVKVKLIPKLREHKYAKNKKYLEKKLGNDFFNIELGNLDLDDATFKEDLKKVISNGGVIKISPQEGHSLDDIEFSKLNYLMADIIVDRDMVISNFAFSYAFSEVIRNAFIHGASGKDVYLRLSADAREIEVINYNRLEMLDLEPWKLYTGFGWGMRNLKEVLGIAYNLKQWKNYTSAQLSMPIDLKNLSQSELEMQNRSEKWLKDNNNSKDFYHSYQKYAYAQKLIHAKQKLLAENYDESFARGLIAILTADLYAENRQEAKEELLSAFDKILSDEENLKNIIDHIKANPDTVVNDMFRRLYKRIVSRDEEHGLKWEGGITQDSLSALLYDIVEEGEPYRAIKEVDANKDMKPGYTIDLSAAANEGWVYSYSSIKEYQETEIDFVRCYLTYDPDTTDYPERMLSIYVEELKSHDINFNIKVMDGIGASGRKDNIVIDVDKKQVLEATDAINHVTYRRYSKHFSGKMLNANVSILDGVSWVKGITRSEEKKFKATLANNEEASVEGYVAMLALPEAMELIASKIKSKPHLESRDFILSKNLNDKAAKLRDRMVQAETSSALGGIDLTAKSSKTNSVFKLDFSKVEALLKSDEFIGFDYQVLGNN